MGWGSSMRRGGGRKASSRPWKLVSMGFEGGDLGRVQKAYAKEEFVLTFFSTSPYNPI